MRYKLADHEWFAIKPMLPNKPRGVPRVSDRRVLTASSGLAIRGTLARFAGSFCPSTTCHNRFVRWRRAVVWGRIIDALAVAHHAAIQMIDTCIVRVHQHEPVSHETSDQSMGRSGGGLTSKIHAVIDSNGLPVRLAFSPARHTVFSLRGSCCLASNRGQCCLLTAAMMPAGFSLPTMGMMAGFRTTRYLCGKAISRAISLDRFLSYCKVRF
jgi:transposase